MHVLMLSCSNTCRLCEFCVCYPQMKKSLACPSGGNREVGPGHAGGNTSLVYTASSGISNFPDYVSLGLVDDVQISCCDSNTRVNKPSQEWMRKVEEEDPQYWESETKVCLKNQNTFKRIIDIAKQLFNQTEGVHVYKKMMGCEWDSETGMIKGYDQYGYDGEDFTALDLMSETWTAPKQEAIRTKHKWDRDVFEKEYLTKDCIDWLKKYVNYGRSFLMRSDLPRMSFLQKTSSSPVSCHATGFYPNRAEMFWRKDGVKDPEGVVKGKILPNNDGTFQMTVDINLSSVSPEDWRKYECVFQLSGEKEFLSKVEKAKIRTNEAPFSFMIIPITVAVVVLAVIAVIGFILYKKKNAKCPPSPVETHEVQEEMFPTA
ncbi:class I histocompatibility antigen, F10 alpha chain-like [Girardinichthys multiradiatus]|uniref:class I histocompatibility antigen, F10 alpha chain-like n=1 Tax=Girardinichthys multiradiatus TaxID=208333 RepID=UPI001FAB6386|nr:class I histocompatibility antigen, F10 alpha chain-like [Girardinichthys multiradiatus]